MIKIKIVLVFLKITMISLTTDTTSIQDFYLAFNIACWNANTYLKSCLTLKAYINVQYGLTDKGQFQYLKKLKEPQVGNYLYTTKLLSLR